MFWRYYPIIFREPTENFFKTCSNKMDRNKHTYVVVSTVQNLYVLKKYLGQLPKCGGTIVLKHVGASSELYGSIWDRKLLNNMCNYQLQKNSDQWSCMIKQTWNKKWMASDEFIYMSSHSPFSTSSVRHSKGISCKQKPSARWCWVLWQVVPDVSKEWRW
jgi:hypothetical protein